MPKMFLSAEAMPQWMASSADEDPARPQWTPVEFVCAECEAAPLQVVRYKARRWACQCTPSGVERIDAAPAAIGSVG